MNREEALEYFKNKTVVLTEEEALANAMAIKALEQEPTTKNNLGVEEVTALAEWTTKLTKECEEAYNKGYADGMKALEQEPILDKIRAEIERQEKWLMDAGYNAYNVDIAFSSIKSVVDKYKAESEVKDGENNY